MNIVCPKCKTPLRISDDAGEEAFRCPRCNQPLRLPKRDADHAGVGPQSPSPSKSRHPRRPEGGSDPSPRRAAVIAGVLIGSFIAVIGFCWFGVLYAMPWAGWDSPIGSSIRSLHGVAALGFAALLPLSIGLALTPRFAALCSALGLLLFLLVALAASGLTLLLVASGSPTAESLFLLPIYGSFAVASGTVHLLLRKRR